MRERLPATRRSVTHKAVIYAERIACPHCKQTLGPERVKFFFTVGFFEDGRPAEVFLHMDEAGSTLDGLCDAWATAVSMLLQYGASAEELERKFAFQRFEPAGMTECAEVRRAHSVVDYVVRWLGGSAAAGAAAATEPAGAAAATEPAGAAAAIEPGEHDED